MVCRVEPMDRLLGRRGRGRMGERREGGKREGREGGEREGEGVREKKGEGEGKEGEGERKARGRGKGRERQGGEGRRERKGSSNVITYDVWLCLGRNYDAIIYEPGYSIVPQTSESLPNKAI